jgi:Ca2+-binding EF-hand superfamily protein
MSMIDPSTRDRLAKAGIGRDKLEELASAFRLFDNDNTGLITVENLRYILEEQFGAFH